MKKQTKRIALTKETLRMLSDEADLRQAEGGAGGGILPISTVNTCRCPSVSCIHVGAC